MIDISKILLTLEGIDLYSTLIGDCKLHRVVTNKTEPVLVVSFNRGNATYYITFDKYGRYLGRCRTNEKEAKHYLEDEILITSDECLLFPSKDNLTWKDYNPPLSIIDTPIYCLIKDTPVRSHWEIRRYGGTCGGKAFVFPAGYSSKTCDKGNFLHMMDIYEIMIPYKVFDLNNLDESMKYNDKL